jgi:hypothetical protein
MTVVMTYPGGAGTWRRTVASSAGVAGRLPELPCVAGPLVTSAGLALEVVAGELDVAGDVGEVLVGTVEVGATVVDGVDVVGAGVVVDLGLVTGVFGRLAAACEGGRGDSSTRAARRPRPARLATPAT